MRSFPIWVSLFLVCSRLSLADADLTLLKDWAGNYSVLERDSGIEGAETLTLFAEEAHIGVNSYAIAGVPRPLSSIRLMANKVNTILTKIAGGVRQSSVSGELTFKIDYLGHEGYLTIQSELCPRQKNCERHTMIVSRGGAPGKEISASDFFRRFRGEYRIELVGGAEPKPSNRDAYIDTDADPKEAGVYVRYCPPHSSICLAGDHYFKYEKTKVFEEKLSGATLYRLILGSYPGLKSYQWLLTGKKFRFRDYAVKLDDKTIFLEHQMVLAGKD